MKDTKILKDGTAESVLNTIIKQFWQNGFLKQEISSRCSI
jgi:hypothetical protein